MVVELVRDDKRVRKTMTYIGHVQHRGKKTYKKTNSH